MKYEAHEYANLFPMMTAMELDALSEDIKANGLRHPIVLYEGEVLDGRNRLLACERVGAEPTFTEYEGDAAGALAMVESLNIERRALTSGQRAIVAARRWGLEPKKRGGDRTTSKVQSVPISLDAIAKKYKVSKTSITQTRDLLAHAPDLAAQVESCALSLADAHRQLQARAEQARRDKAEADRKAKDVERVAHYREAVSNGEMTLEEALEKVQRDAMEEEEKRRNEASARRIWCEGVQGALAAVKTWVAARDDGDLAWNVQKDAPGMKAPFAADEVEAAGNHLQRLATILRNAEVRGGER